MKHILIVDDSRFVQEVAGRYLQKTFRVSKACNGFAALAFLKNNPVDLILMDIEMPELDGIETLKRIKMDSDLNAIPVIFLTGVSRTEAEEICLCLGASDFIHKPFHEPVLLGRVNRILEIEDYRQNMEQRVLEKTRELEDLTVQTIITFANSIDAKDSYTKNHSFHVAKYSQALGRTLGFSKLEIRNLYYTALLHDIGKIGIPDHILSKPGKLTEEEFAIMRKHPNIGGSILADIKAIPNLSVGASTHHERFDGTGYPIGKKGSEIPLVGRIVGITDAVDAMSSNRSYRVGMPKEKVMAELVRCSGTQFDPMLVEIMCMLLERGVDLSENGESDHEDKDLSTLPK